MWHLDTRIHVLCIRRALNVGSVTLFIWCQFIKIHYLTARWHAQGWNAIAQLGLGHNDDVYEPLDSVIDLGDFEPDEVGCGANFCCSVATNRVSLKWYVDWWQCLVFHKRPCVSLSLITFCVHDQLGRWKFRPTRIWRHQ